MDQLPQPLQNLLGLFLVIALIGCVGFVAWCLCAIGSKLKTDEQSQSIEEPPRKRQSHVDGG